MAKSSKTSPKFKILWHSNSPMVQTGYGVQSKLFLTELARNKHTNYISCYWGHEAHTVQSPIGLLLPKGIDQWGNDSLVLYHKSFPPDITIALMDIWVLDSEMLDKVPTIAYLPIDHDPIPGRVMERIYQTAGLIAMSKFGYDLLEKQIAHDHMTEQVELFYLPHAYDPKAYFPLDKQEERKKWGHAEDDFVITVVGANKGFPSRKSLPGIIRAFSIFSKFHPNAKLYLHTVMANQPFAINLYEILSLYDVNPDRVTMVDVPMMNAGWYGDDKMRSIYSASDVLLAPSMGEGFGIPVLEAQACGLPVITTDFSAQTELTFGGVCIPIDDDDLELTAQYSHQARVPVSKIVNALEEVYEAYYEDGGVLAAQWRYDAIKGAQPYKIRKVYREYLKPILPRLAELCRENLFNEVTDDDPTSSDVLTNIEKQLNEKGVNTEDMSAHDLKIAYRDLRSGEAVTLTTVDIKTSENS